MRRKVIWLPIAGITFIIGVASAMIWFQFPNLRGSSHEPAAEPKPLRGSERMHICLKRFDINLGDNFDYVDGIVNLVPDPNGPNENISWHKGKLADFLSVSQPSIEIDKENRLNPSIFCTFDDQKKLKSFSISWTHEGQQSNSIKREIIDALIEREHFCMAGKNLTLDKSTFIDQVDFGDYVQEFAYDFSERPNFWGVSYSITMK